MQRKHSSKLQRIYAGVESLHALLLELIRDVGLPLGLTGVESEVDVFNVGTAFTAVRKGTSHYDSTCAVLKMRALP